MEFTITIDDCGHRKVPPTMQSWWDFSFDERRSLVYFVLSAIRLLEED